MKKYQFIIIICFFQVQMISILKAQTYCHIIDTNRIWITQITGAFVAESSFNTFFLDGDTIINNKSYKKVYNHSVNSADTISMPDTTLVVNPEDTIIYSAAVREDTSNMKVYSVFTNDTIEKLMYDFSLNIGDSVILYNNAHNENLGIVQEIDYIKVDNICRKRLQLKSSACFDFWIEGLGSTNGLLYPSICFVDFGPFFSLHYIIENNDTIFNYSNNIVTCDTNSIKENINIIKNKVFIYPNPFSDYTIIKLNKIEKNNFLLTITDITGKIIKIIDISSKEKFQLNGKDFDNGIYLFQFSNGKNIIDMKKVIVY